MPVAPYRHLPALIFNFDVIETVTSAMLHTFFLCDALIPLRATHLTGDVGRPLPASPLFCTHTFFLCDALTPSEQRTSPEMPVAPYRHLPFFALIRFFLCDALIPLRATHLTGDAGRPLPTSP
jgi:hypothetical protein